MNDNVIAFVADRGYRFALAAMLVNLHRTQKIKYDVVVYYDGFEESDCKILREIEPNIHFIPYARERWEKEHCGEEEISVYTKRHIDRFSYLNIIKYKAFELLDRYKRVLLLDLDMLIEGDISELFDLNGVAWKNGLPFKQKLLYGLNPDEAEEIFKIVPQDFPSPNGGLLYCSREGIDIPFKQIVEDGRFFISQYKGKFTASLDELAAAYIVAKNNLKLTILDPTLWNAFPQDCRDDTRIVHFMGKYKPWNNEAMNKLFPLWMGNHIVAKKYGNLGDSIPQSMIEEGRGAFVTKALNASRWKTFFKETKIHIPMDLCFEPNMSNSRIVLRYSENIYYELTLEQHREGIGIGMWLCGRFYSEDKVIGEAIEKLNQRNPNVFKVNKDSRGIYISTGLRGKDTIQGLFNYFYQITMGVLQTIEKNVL